MTPNKQAKIVYQDIKKYTYKKYYFKGVYFVYNVINCTNNYLLRLIINYPILLLLLIIPPF